MNSLVSVVIPTYNRAYCIKKSIKSVLNQTYKNLELLIVDDCSDDNTEEVIKQFNDNRIRYIKLNNNCGPSRARNIGIKKARGEFIAFQDSDDIWYNNKLELQMNEFQSDSQCQLVFCQHLIKGEVSSLCPAEQSFDVQKYKYGMFEILLKGNRIGTPTIVIRKDVLDKLGGFNENIKTLEDWELVLRVTEKYNIKYINKVLMEVYPSKNGINRITGYHKAAVSVVILKEFWDKYYRDKRIFDWVLKDFINDFITIVDNKEKQMLIDSICQINDHQVLYEIFSLLINEVQTIKLDTEIEKLRNEIELRNRSLNVEKYKKMLVVKMINDFTDNLFYEKIKNYSDHIAIYGAGDIAKCLVPLLLKLGITIHFLIDKSPKEISNIPCYTIDTIPSKNVDIIITAYDPQKEIINRIHKYKLTAIYLDDLL